MGTVRFDLANFVTIGLIAFVMIYLINWGLKSAGYGQYAA